MQPIYMLAVPSPSEIFFLLFSAVVKMEGRILQFSRNFSFSRALLSSMSEPFKEASGHQDGLQLWKKLFLFGALPATGLSLINVALEEEPPRPEFIKYPHLRRRVKPFPWRDGVQTLFHNPHRNALPDGYEEAEHA